MSRFPLLEIALVAGFVLLIALIAIPGVKRIQADAQAKSERFESRYDTEQLKILCDRETNNLVYIYYQHRGGGVAVVQDGC